MLRNIRLHVSVGERVVCRLLAAIFIVSCPDSVDQAKEINTFLSRLLRYDFGPQSLKVDCAYLSTSSRKHSNSSVILPLRRMEVLPGLREMFTTAPGICELGKEAAHCSDPGV